MDNENYNFIINQKLLDISKNEINNLKKELNIEKNKNRTLQETINNLNITIERLKQKNNNDVKNYDKEIKKFTNNNQNLSSENYNLKDKIKKLNIISQNNLDEIDKLYKLIEELNNKIEELNEYIDRYPFRLEKGEKILSIRFTSMSQKVNYSIICKNTDNLVKLEAELCKEFPELSETKNYFICKGTVIDKFKKLNELNFKNGDIIIIDQREY